MVLFPHFEYKLGMRAIDSHLELRGKYLQRLLMREGPLIQPDNFFLIHPSKEHKDDLKKLLGSLHEDQFNSHFINDQHALSLDSAVETLLAERRIKTPFVIKPNSGSTGVGIIFVDKKDEDYILSMRMPREGLNAIGAPLSFYYLRDNTFQRLTNETDNEFKVLIPAREMDKTLKELLLAAHVTKVPFTIANRYQQTGDYNPVLVESNIPSWKFEGRAYETRHQVVGNLAARTVTEIIDYYGRAGSSNLFANQMEARDNTKGLTLKRQEMYNPLLESFNLNNAEFCQKLRMILTSAFSYYAQRLCDEGFRFDGKSELQIDLMWQQPQNEGEYPQPAMTECEWAYLHPDLWSTTKTPALKYVYSK